MQSILISRLLFNLRAADDDQGTQADVSHLVFRDLSAHGAKRPAIFRQESESSGIMTETTHATISPSSAQSPDRVEWNRVSRSQSNDIQEVGVVNLL